MPPRLFWPSLLLSAALLAVCAVVAVSLHRQQSEIAELLAENLVSSRASDDLTESLFDLQSVFDQGGDQVDGLVRRIDLHLREVRSHVDHDDEKWRAAGVAEAIAGGHAAWLSVPPPNDARREAALRVAAEKAAAAARRADDLSRYNARRVEASAVEHRRVLRALAWGMAGIGVTGAVAGVVLGQAAARWLRRSVRRLQVQIEDAAGKLAPPGAEIVLTGEGDAATLEGQMGLLAARVEETVRRLQQREREVLRAEQLAAVGQLAAGVAHEIRNPLTAIKMLTQVAAASGGSLEPDDLAVVEREVRRMERSLQTFLDFARPPKLNRVGLDLGAAVARTLDLIRGRAAHQGVAVKLERPPGAVTVTADPDQLQQVFVNLALNALDVMPAGGELRARVEAATATRGPRVSVCDTGPGIALDLLPRLFTPFVSGKETGLGLGLVTSRRVAEDHGGSVAARNRPGGGAEFVVQLPPETPEIPK